MEELNMEVQVEKRERIKYKRKYLTARGYAVGFGAGFVLCIAFLTMSAIANIRLQKEIQDLENKSTRLVVVK